MWNTCAYKTNLTLSRYFDTTAGLCKRLFAFLEPFYLRRVFLFVNTPHYFPESFKPKAVTIKIVNTVTQSQVQASGSTPSDRSWAANRSARCRSCSAR